MAEVKTQGAVEAMEVAEASRETEWEKPSFVGDLFLGKLNIDLVWAEIAVAAVAGSAFYGVIALIERAVTFWHPSVRGGRA